MPFSQFSKFCIISSVLFFVAFFAFDARAITSISQLEENFTFTKFNISQPNLSQTFTTPEEFTFETVLLKWAPSKITADCTFTIFFFQSPPNGGFGSIAEFVNTNTFAAPDIPIPITFQLNTPVTVFPGVDYLFQLRPFGPGQECDQVNNVKVRAHNLFDAFPQGEAIDGFFGDAPISADTDLFFSLGEPPPAVDINISVPAENDILTNQSVAWEFIYTAPGTQTDIVVTIEENSLIVQSRQFELFATERTDDTHVITRSWIVPATGILEATARLLDCSGPTLPCTLLATSSPRTFTIAGVAPPELPEETLPDALNFYQENAPTFLGPSPTPTIIYTSITSFISAIMSIPLGIANGFGDWTANVIDTDDIAAFGASIGIILAYQGAFNDLFGSLPVFQALFLVLTVLFGVGIYKLLRTALQLIRG